LKNLLARQMRNVTRFWDGLFALGEGQARTALHTLAALLPPAAPSRPRRRPSSPAVEPLEDRWLPSTNPVPAVPGTLQPALAPLPHYAPDGPDSDDGSEDDVL